MFMLLLLPPSVAILSSSDPMLGRSVNPECLLELELCQNSGSLQRVQGLYYRPYLRETSSMIKLGPELRDSPAEAVLLFSFCDYLMWSVCATLPTAKERALSL